VSNVLGQTEEEAVATIKMKLGKTAFAGIAAAFAGAMMMATPAAAQQTI
jgi:hypothetical protein